MIIRRQRQRRNRDTVQRLFPGPVLIERSHGFRELRLPANLHSSSLYARPGTASDNGDVVLPAPFKSIPLMAGVTGVALMIDEFTLGLKPNGSETTPAMFRFWLGNTGRSWKSRLSRSTEAVSERSSCKAQETTNW